MRRSGANRPSLVLTAHGSADPSSAANARAVAATIRRTRPDLTVRVAFCERTQPGLSDVLGSCPGVAVVTPLLLADAYHARVDIPHQIAESGAASRVRQAGVLGADDRLISVLSDRLAEAGVSRHDREVGVLVVAIGSTLDEANACTRTVATRLGAGTAWAGVTTAFATGPGPSLAQGADTLRRRGARRLVVAPWFLAPGRLPDRVAVAAAHDGIAMAAPLGAHPLVAATVLDRFDEAVAAEQFAA